MTSLQFAEQLRVSYSPPPSLVTQIIAVVVDTPGARLIIGALACLSTAQRGRAKGECSQIMYSARSLGNPLFGLITFAWATGREIRNADQRISIALVAKLLSFWRSCLREHWIRVAWFAGNINCIYNSPCVYKVRRDREKFEALMTNKESRVRNERKSISRMFMYKCLC